MRYFIIGVLALALTACQEKKKAPAPAAAEHSDVYYTCSMHPQVKQDGPGKCPICGMELIPVKRGAGSSDDNIVLSDLQVQLGGIQVDTVSGSNMGDRVTLTATLNVDETKNTSVNVRVAGRIERLHVRSTGDVIRKGDRLFDLYSEELNNAKQEYLLALERERTLDKGVIDFKQLVGAAKNKLLLWGMSGEQVEELSRTGKMSAVTTFYSPVSGTVTEIEGREGGYLGQGGAVLRVADLSVIWAEAQVYTAQLAGLDRDAKAIVRVPDLPGKEWPGRIGFVNPEIDPDTRVDLVRIPLSNPEGLLRPGMSAYATLVSRQSHSLNLPMTAVIRNGGGAVVWLQVGHNTFRPAMVETGLEDGDRVEIRSGLKPGDKVVVNGAYLLNSEYIFKHGTDPMAGMDMSNMKM